MAKLQQEAFGERSSKRQRVCLSAWDIARRVPTSWRRRRREWTLRKRHFDTEGRAHCRAAHPDKRAKQGNCRNEVSCSQIARSGHSPWPDLRRGLVEDLPGTEIRDPRQQLNALLSPDHQLEPSAGQPALPHNMSVMRLLQSSASGVTTNEGGIDSSPVSGRHRIGYCNST